jgi:hypothetical protein
VNEKEGQSSGLGIWRDIDPVAAGKAWDQWASEHYRPKPGAPNTLPCRYCGAFMFVTQRFCGECDQPREIVQFRLTHESHRTGVPYQDLIERELERGRVPPGSPTSSDLGRDIALHREVSQLQKRGWHVLNADGWHVKMSGHKSMEFSFTLVRWLYEYVQSRRTRTWIVYVDKHNRVSVTIDGEPIP